MRLALVYQICLCLLIPLASRAGASVNREDLFRRAFSSAAFFLTLANEDKEFGKSLPDDEKKMLEAVRHAAQEARNFEWFSRNFPQPTADVYEYAFAGHYFDEREQALPIELQSRYGLEFSSNPEIFARPNGEKPRAAVAGPQLDDPIFVNRELINRADNPWTFPEALQIMIHEFGHKLGKRENEDAINRLAAKIRSRVEALQVEAKTSQGTIRAYRADGSLFEDWLETTLKGRYLGSNIPNRIEPFRAIDDEGLYVFVENASGITDISREIHQDLRARAEFKNHEGLKYKWKPFHFFAGVQLSVRELPDGRVRIAVDTRHSQAAIPFIGRGDPDPVEYHPWSRLREKGEYGRQDYHRLDWTWDLNGARPVKANVWPRPLIEESAGEVAKVGEKWEGNDLVLTYKIAPEVKIRGSGLTEARPFLIFSLDGEPLEIEGSRAPTDPSEVSFRFAEARTRMSGELKILNVEVEPQVRNLGFRYYLRKRLLLERGESYRLSGQSAPPPRLLRIEVFNGANWIPLSAAHPTVNGDSRLRFTFDSTTLLSELKLEMNVNQTDTIQSWFRLGRERSLAPPGKIQVPPTRSLITIPVESLRQEIQDQTLTVTFPLDRDTRTIKTIARNISPGDATAWMPKVFEMVRTETLPQRVLLGFEASNRSGRTLRRSLSEPLNELPSGGGCRSLFR